MKKAAKKQVATPANKRQISIQEIRDAMHEIFICWAWFLNPQGGDVDFYLERIEENGKLILVYTNQWQTQESDRPFDPILDASTVWHGYRAIQLAQDIASLICVLRLNHKVLDRATVIHEAESRGLPSKMVPALSICDSIATAMKSPDGSDKFPGLRMLFESMQKRSVKPTLRDVAREWLRQRGSVDDISVDTVYHHIKNNTRFGEWTGSKHAKNAEN